jgi:hypothetical protein
MTYKQRNTDRKCAINQESKLGIWELELKGRISLFLFFLPISSPSTFEVHFQCMFYKRYITPGEDNS